MLTNSMEPVMHSASHLPVTQHNSIMTIYNKVDWPNQLRHCETTYSKTLL